MKKVSFILPALASIVALVGAVASTVKADNTTLTNKGVHIRTPVSGTLLNCTTVTCSNISANENPLCGVTTGGDIYVIPVGGAQLCTTPETVFKYKIPQ
jgi:hypothetical protein